MSAVADYKLVRNSSVGPELTEDEAKLLAGKLGVRQLKDGELLVKEGEADQTLFILASGKVSVSSKDAGGADKQVYLMKEGECAGTRAFVERSPRKATLRSVGASVVYTLSPADFDTCLDKNARLAFKVMRALFRVTHANLSRMNQESKELANYINKTQGRY
jgi:CRP-like cAMP-binding protein